MKYSMTDLNKRFSPDIRELNPELFEPLEIDKKLFADDTKKRGNKYGARKVVADGRVFDSQAEYHHWLVLKSQEEAGEITDLIHQYKIILLESFVYQGEKIRQITYSADFTFVKDGVYHIQDLKSIPTSKTESFRIRWRLLQWYYRERDDVVCEIIIS